MKRIVIAVFVLLCICRLPAQTETNIALTTTAELLALSVTEAKKGLRFDLTAQIIHKYEGITGCMFVVRDESGGVHLYAEDNPKSFTYNPGDVVRWRGATDVTTDRNLYAKCDATDIIGRKPLPPVVPADPKLIPSGRYNYMRISVKGNVVTAFRDEIDPENQYLALDADGCTVYAALSELATAHTNLSELIDAEVEVTGTCMATENGRRIFLGPRLAISAPSDIRILKAPPTDPFAVPRIDDPHHIRAAEIAKTGRRRIDGIVTATWRGRQFMLKTGTGNRVRVELSGGPLPACGTRVAVVGRPSTDLFHLNLSQSIWKPLLDAALHDADSGEVPSDTSLRDMLFDQQGNRKFKPQQQGRLFRLKGKVRSLPLANDPAARMMLDCDGDLVMVDASSCPDAIAGLEIDSTVSVVGVCVFNVQNWNPTLVFPRIEEMFLVPRTSADITVIAHPPWWTPGRLAFVIGSLLALLAVVALWIRILNHVIQRRTRQLTDERLAHAGAEMRIEERTRLAVELHDALSQTLTGVAFQIDAAEAARRKDPSKVQYCLSVARRTLANCRKELHNCLWDLRSRALDAKDTAEAIRETIDPHIDACEVSLDVAVPRERLSDSSFHAVLRMVRELVVNAIRHGHAQHIKIDGRCESGSVSFTVADDGCGFDPESRPDFRDGHFGLHGIMERLDRLNGDLSIDSAPGHGARITITVRSRK